MADKIPTRLKVFLRNEVEVTDPRGTKHKVRPAFVTDAEASAKAHDTASRWVRFGYGPGVTRGGVAESIEVQNLPIFRVTIVDLEERGEGGRAWKVIWNAVPDGQDEKEFKDIESVPCLVDLREDVFVDALFNNSVYFANPVQYGELHVVGKWIRHGSQMRIVSLNSDLHKQAKKNMLAMSTPMLRPKQLELGGVYTSKAKGVPRIYMGRVRYDGKLKCAWLPLWFHQGQSEKDFQGWYNAVHDTSSYGIMLTGGSGVRFKLAQVTLRDTHRPQRITNGTDGTLNPLQLEDDPWGLKPQPERPLNWNDDPFGG